MSPPESVTPRRPATHALRTVVLTAAVVAILDGTDAITFWSLRGVAASRIFRYIASALLGPEAAKLGNGSVALGVALHCGVALGLTTGYWAIVRNRPRLAAHWFVSGVTYGLATYVLMNYAVLPLTRVPRAAGLPPWPVLTNNVLAHVACVGVPIALGIWLGLRDRPKAFTAG